MFDFHAPSSFNLNRVYLQLFIENNLYDSKQQHELTQGTSTPN